MAQRTPKAHFATYPSLQNPILSCVAIKEMENHHLLQRIQIFIRWIRESAEGLSVWQRWRFWGEGRSKVQWCIRRCSSSLVKEDTRWEPWQGCHYKDEPPVNARALNTRIYAHYIPSSTHCPIQYSLCLCWCLYAHPTLICQFIAATHFNFFFTFWYSVGCFLPPNICLI